MQRVIELYIYSKFYHVLTTVSDTVVVYSHVRGGRFLAAEIYHTCITDVNHYDFEYNNQIDLSLLWMIHGNGLYKQTKFA